jgi:hypothetical protein
LFAPRHGRSRDEKPQSQIACQPAAKASPLNGELQNHAVTPNFGSEKNVGAPELVLLDVRLLEVWWKSFCRDGNLLRENCVRKLWSGGGKALDAMCMKDEEVFFAARAAHLSAVARGNSPHTSRKISALGFAWRRFPRIHKRHHNNKVLNFVFRIHLL